MRKARSGTIKNQQSNRQITQSTRQVNQYDKILRENIEAALPGLIKNLLDIHVIQTEELPDDIQHTKERKPDVLKKVTDQNGETFVLHIEFQVEDESEMVFRMAEYYIMLQRKYKIPVRQYVIYIGPGIPAMADYFRSEQINFKYQLINLSAIDYRLLLRSENPEEKMLAILANLDSGDSGSIIENIVEQVITSSKGNFSKLRHIQQLRILANLRNLGVESLQFMDSIAKYITKEKDIFYQLGQKEGIEEGIEKGVEKGLEKGKAIFVRNLLLNTDFAVPKIASLSNVTEAFVEEVKKTLQ